jgi:hypothetical protein
LVGLHDNAGNIVHATIASVKEYSYVIRLFFYARICIDFPTSCV